MINVTVKSIVAAKNHFFVHGLGYSDCSTDGDVVGLILDLLSEIHRASDITPDMILLPQYEQVMNFLTSCQDKEQ